MRYQDAQFPWHTLRSIIGGTSAIDVPRLHVRSLAEAEDFLECYGFDFHNASHRRELEGLRNEAIAFIEEELLDEGEEIPPEIREEQDPRQLLQWCSTERSSRQRWACALLRVGHTFAHCHSYFNEKYGTAIRTQILERFEPHLLMTDDGLVLGKDPAIPLVDFEVKPLKTARSVAMKLLHKVENVAADIFDYVGVRFITRERFDTLFVVKYLREHNVVMFANVKPSRARNTLLDLDWLQRFMEELDRRVTEGAVSAHDAMKTLRRAVREADFPGPPQPSYNPYSAAQYHSLQFTGRQLIRVPDPTGHDEEVRFFFPFEVQILDQESYELSRSGYASHDLYKARQREAVRFRVLGELVETGLDESSVAEIMSPIEYGLGEFEE